MDRGRPAGLLSSMLELGIGRERVSLHLPVFDVVFISQEVTLGPQGSCTATGKGQPQLWGEQAEMEVVLQVWGKGQTDPTDSKGKKMLGRSR